MAEAAAAAEPKASFLVESERRLSESMLWRLQRDGYSTLGPDAWLSGAVPWWVTSNAFIAAAYARTLLAFLEDCGGPAAPLGAIDPAEPVYVVELAAGSGHFGFLCLQRLQRLQASLPALAHLKIRYVLTDLAASNLEAWAKKECLQPFLEKGLLDFARFDIENDKQIRLERTGTVLAAGATRNPLLVVANYTFDTVAQDMFRVKEGKLLEGLVALASPQAEDVSAPDPDLMKRLVTRWSLRRAELPYYGEPESDGILASYAERLGDTVVLFPIGAIRGLRTLLEVAGGRLFLLAGDKGVAHEDEFLFREDPQIALHGRCFSMMVNLHAIGEYVRRRGGVAFHADRRDKQLKVSAFAMGAPEAGLLATRRAFDQILDGFGPHDYHALVQALRKDYKEPPLEVVLALMRLSDWDYQIVLHWAGAMAKQGREAPESVKVDLARALERCYESFYPMQRDLAFEIARVYAGMERLGDALRYYRESLRSFGEHPATLYNSALCLYRVQRPREALGAVRQALKLSPNHGGARDWRNRLEAELGLGPDDPA